MRYGLAVFDFDGTLVNSEACIRTSLQQALAEHGCQSDLNELREQIGLPLETIIASQMNQATSREILQAVVMAFRSHYASFEHELITLYPDVLLALETLRASNITMAIATSKPTISVRVTLDRLDIGRFFSCIVGEDQVAKGKPDPEMIVRILGVTRHQAAEAIVIGDTTFDVAMATAAGVASCAVSYGNHDAERLRLARPTFLVDSPRAIPSVLGCA